MNKAASSPIRGLHITPRDNTGAAGGRLPAIILFVSVLTKQPLAPTFQQSPSHEQGQKREYGK